MVKAVGLSPAARRTRFGQHGLSLLRDAQELFSNQVETRVRLAQYVNGVVGLSDPLPLEALEFMDAPRGNAIAGVMVRIADNEQYAMMVPAVGDFVGFYILPTGAVSLGDELTAAAKLNDELEARLVEARALREPVTLWSLVRPLVRPLRKVSWWKAAVLGFFAVGFVGPVPAVIMVTGYVLLSAYRGRQAA